LASIDAAFDPDHNRLVTTARWIARTLLAIVILAAALTWPPGPSSRHGRTAHGCQAAAPGGNAAAIEPAGVAVTTQDSASAAGVSTRAGAAITPGTHLASIPRAFTFARPHDPRHLHAFSLLI